MKYVILIISLCFVQYSYGKGNEKKELRNLFKTSDTKTTYTSYLKNSSNELEFSAALLFVGYKTFFSSQDMQSCVFYPSCSVYAIECLRTEPVPKSIFKIFDRLTRCHPLASPKHYQIHNSGQFYDPVKD